MIFNRKRDRWSPLPVVFVLLVSQSLVWVRIREVGSGDRLNLIGSQLVLLLMGLTIWYLLLYLLGSGGRMRRWLKIVIGFSLSAVTSLLYGYGAPFVPFPNEAAVSASSPESTGILLLRGAVIAAIFLPFAIYLIESRRFQRESVEMEQLKRMDLQGQLMLLQEQINPHFLFNALNVLKSGTRDNWVKVFVGHLADAYRYLLDHKIDKHLVPVASELQFVDAYLYILKARFGTALQVHIDSEARGAPGQIPPMSLQTLIENAVKHNIVDHHQQLEIMVSYTPGYLIVRNNRQKKTKSFYRFQRDRAGKFTCPLSVDFRNRH